jgi:gamma-butyrobetaine dioxygenase
LKLMSDHLIIDGQRFHFSWLRDNCPCPRCRDAGSFQKIYDPCDRKAVPESITREGNAVIFKWDDDETPHKISSPWLLANAYDSPRVSPAAPVLRLWDHASITRQPETIQSPSDSGGWLGDLVALGFARIGNLTRKDLPRFIGDLGPVSYASKQVDFVDVKIIPGGDDLSLTSHALSPHTDQSYMGHSHPLVLILHCIENTVTGGESVLVDGFKVLEDLQRDKPDDFAILVKTTVTFRQYEPANRYFYNRSIRTIEQNFEGSLKAIHFSHKNFTVDLPFEEMGRFYEAYGELLSRLKSPRYQYEFKLEQHQCLFMANHRVLHGRREFDANSGIRHFSAAFLSHNYVDARLACESDRHLKRYQTAAE